MPDPVGTGGRIRLPNRHGVFMSLHTLEYRLDRILGIGGNATVYQATHVELSKPVAVKIPYRNPVKGLLAEAALLSMLHHHAIPSIEARMVSAGCEVVIMEYVDGFSLRDIIQVQGAIPVSVALEIVATVASALHALHQPEHNGGRLQPIVHCDVKPENILVTRQGAVKLIDFDSAQFESRDPRRRVFGTTRYMAPERMLRITTPAADIFSLGTLLLELTSGSYPPVRTEPEDFPERVRELTALLCDEVTDLILSMRQPAHESRPTALDVERVCHEVAHETGLPRLSTWARKTLPKEHASTLEVQSDLIGRIIPDRPVTIWDRLRWRWNAWSWRRQTRRRWR